MATAVRNPQVDTYENGEKASAGDETAYSTPGSSSKSEFHERGDRKDIKVEMEMMMMMHGLGQDAGAPKKHYFPSAASLGSSVWSSSGYSSQSSDSYEWSDVSGSDASSDYSSYSGSESSSEEEENGGKKGIPPPKMSSKPPLPPPVPEGLPIGLGGLPLTLESLKRDLEKVGRAILQSNAGEIAAERAQTLASINWLASHVPNAVLDQLGHETRALMEEERGGETKDDDSQDSLVQSIVESDAMSDVSDLSVADINELDLGHGPPMDATDAIERSASYGDLANLSNVMSNKILTGQMQEFSENNVIPEDTPSHQATGIFNILENNPDQNSNSPFSPGFLSPAERRRSSIATERRGGLMEDVSFKPKSGILDILPHTADGDFMAVSERGKSSFLPRPRSTGNFLSQSERGLVSPAGRRPSSFAPKLNPTEDFATHPGFISPPERRRSSLTPKVPDFMAQSERGYMSPGERRRSSFTSERRPSVTSDFSAEQNGSKATPRSKGMKGLFKRFVKRNKSDMHSPGSPSQASEDPSHDVTALKNPMQPKPMDIGKAQNSTAVGSEDDDASQSLAGSSASVYSYESTITNEKKSEEKEKMKSRRLPYFTKYRCALLFVDISGFTKLSTLLDPESLSKAINSYFQLIVNVVLDGKGDLLKFAGDAVFIEWKATEDINLESCVESAVKCAAEIISRCADFSVLSNGANGGTSCLVSTQAAKVDTLNVHCGVGAGQMIGVHVGDHELRREYLLLGQPIQQATVATNFASLGEVAISPEAHAILSRVCDLDRDIKKSDGQTPSIIANRDSLKFASRRRMGIHQPKIVNDVSRGVTKHVEGLDVQHLRKYRSMMSLYVHPVVVDNDLAAVDNFKQIKKVQKSAQERHREEAEIRNVFVMFVNPKVETKVSLDEKTDREKFKILNDIMNLSSREIKRFSGHLRQFIVDDKGLVMIITFGLRGTTIPDMVAQRALPATISIHNALQIELGIKSKIGATIGEAYCGVVGGVKRHEYAVLGPSVNLAARLMASDMNPGILVDNNVRMLAHRSYGFNALPPVVAKGYAEPVPIFEPLSPLERGWGRLQPNFVGRKDEIMKIMRNARDMVLNSESASKFVLVEAKSGMGKSTMVAHCIEHIRKLLGANKERLIVTKNVSKESDSLVPFGVFRSILRSVLKSYRSSNDEKSFKSGASIFSSLQHSITYESLSGKSISQSTCNLTTGKSSDIIQSLCRELDMPPSFVSHAMRDLLGLERVPTENGSKPRAVPKPPPTRMMVSFMSRAFKRCTQDARLVVVALDDLHHADEFSWKVIQDLFETSQNMLIIGTSYPTHSMKADETFWRDLHEKYQDTERFLKMGLDCLSRDEISLMIMKTLGLQRKEVKGDVLDGVTIQSGGLPHFVNEILEHVKRQMAIDPDYEIGDMNYDSFGDLVLQRLDSFDLTMRNVLNIGAVIGLSFTLDEVVAVQMRASDSTEAVVRKHTEESLKEAVEGGILECRELSDENESDPDGTIIKKYSFYHAVWRTTLLNLMLEGRKRDLHRTIAETLEEQDVDIGDYMFNTRLFNHWICSHNFSKAAELALSVGKDFEERLGLPAQSIRLYNESLDLLREESENGNGVGGLSAKVLSEVGVDDLAYIIKLQVALGQALSMAQRVTESVAAYQDALRITQAAKASKLLADRSILFPVFSGLSLALKRGHIVQDAECKYEQAMLRRYVQETKLHGDPINILHALSLQADMFARFGRYADALECHKKEIEPLYDVEAHSLDLCDEYGNDLGAQSFSSSTLWNLQLGNTEEALGTCWFVIEEILPKVERRNVHAAFLILYPILWVMKENGFALEAREYFEEYVCEAYTEFYGEGRSTFFLPLYDPILTLLDLAGNADTEPDTMEEYVDWAIDVDNLGFGTLLNSKTGELGRTADSVAAEICYILARQVDDEDTRDSLIENGIEIATEDIEFAKENNLDLSEHCTANLLQKLKSLRD